MKILQVNNFHYLNGGADKMYLETSRLLSNKGHEVQFYSTRNEKNEFTFYDKYFVEEIDYYKQKKISEKVKAMLRFIYSKTAAINLNRLLEEQKPEIAHLHVFQSRLSCSILPVLKKHKIPIVFSVHEYKVLCPVYTFLDNKTEVCEACQGKRFYNCLAKRCNRNSFIYSFISTAESYLRDRFYSMEKYADHVIMVSDFIHNKHVQYKPSLATKASRLYNFNDNDSVRQKGVRGNYFLYFGRLSPEKGILTMLKAFIDKPGFKLKIVGTGAMEEEVKNFIEANSIRNVELLGYKKGNELNDIIRHASFTIVPSEWYESFGLIIIESMALGTPVIGANIGAIPELVKDNVNGFLFQPKNVSDMVEQMERANNTTDDVYQLLAENAQQFATDNFRREDYYTQLMAIYSNCIKSYHEEN